LYFLKCESLKVIALKIEDSPIINLRSLELQLLKKSPAALILLIATLACLAYSVATTSVQWIETTDLGLVTKLPIVYYAGLVLLCCLWFVSLKYKSYLPASLILTFAYVYVAPALIREPVWISNSYYPYGESLLITSTGHLIYNPASLIVSYRFWPMFLYFSSAFKILSGMPDDILLKFFPLFSIGMYGLLTTLVLRVKLALPYAIMGSAILMTGLFIRQQYFGPQAISYIFFLAIMLLLTSLFFGRKGNTKTTIALILVLFVFVTSTHPLTSFVLLMAFLALFLTNRFTSFFSTRKLVGLGWLALIAIVIWLIYNMFQAWAFFRTGLEHFYQIILGLRDLGLYSEPSRIIGSTAMQFNFVTQWAIVGIIGVVSLLAMFQVFRNLRRKQPEMEYLLFNTILIVLLALFAFFGEYGTESYLRAFMFALLPLSFLCVSLMKRKPVLIVTLIAALIFLNIPAQYGADSFRLATSTQIAGTAFIADYTPQNIKLVGKLCYIYIKYNDPLKSFSILNIGLDPPFTHLPNSTVLNEALNQADYIAVSNLEHNYYVFYLGIDPMDQVNPNDTNRIYANGGFTLLQPR
jgi:hypothetical protein